MPGFQKVFILFNKALKSAFRLLEDMGTEPKVYYLAEDRN